MNTRAAIFSLSLMLSGAAITALPAHAQLFGESDEEAARQAHEDGQDNQINQVAGCSNWKIGCAASPKACPAPPARMKSWRIRFRICVRRWTRSREISPTGFAWCRRSSWARTATSRASIAARSARLPPPACLRPGGGYTPGAPLPPLGSGDQGMGGAPQQLGLARNLGHLADEQRTGKQWRDERGPASRRGRRDGAV